jgi:hypothetical protein
MQDWHSTCLGRHTLPRDLSAFEIENAIKHGVSKRRSGAEVRVAGMEERNFVEIVDSTFERPPVLDPRGYESP